MIKALYRKRLRRLLGDESGFSLMEVVVAIAIMVIVATAAASLSLNGISVSRAEERQQVATTIANGYLETVSGWSIGVNGTTGISNLYTGRGKSAVQTAFTANSTLPGVLQTVPVWQTTPTISTVSNGSLPIVYPDPNVLPVVPFVQKGTSYTVTTLIGTCYEQTSLGSVAVPTPADNCTSTVGSAPISLIRVIVIVKWTAGAKCVVTLVNPNGCYYEASTILDPNVDLEWIAH